MGTWAIPNTKEKAIELKNLMGKEIRANKAADKLYKILGDDDLFDTFSEYDSGEDIRLQVIVTLERLIGEPDYTFSEPWEPEARKICAALIKCFWDDIKNLESIPLDEKQAAKNYYTFVRELERLSRKHGVVLNVTGGIYHSHPKNPHLKRMCYNADYGSGDLYSVGFFTD